MKPPESVIGVCRRLHVAGHEAWLVGGAVRDSLLGTTTTSRPMRGPNA